MAGGQKILDGLREAVAGTFSEVTIDGVTWVRKDCSRVAVLEKKFRHLYAHPLGSQTVCAYCGLIRDDPIHNT